MLVAAVKGGAADVGIVSVVMVLNALAAGFVRSLVGEAQIINGGHAVISRRSLCGPLAVLGSSSGLLALLSAGEWSIAVMAALGCFFWGYREMQRVEHVLSHRIDATLTADWIGIGLLIAVCSIADTPYLYSGAYVVAALPHAFLRRKMNGRRLRLAEWTSEHRLAVPYTIEFLAAFGWDALWPIVGVWVLSADAVGAAKIVQLPMMGAGFLVAAAAANVGHKTQFVSELPSKWRVAWLLSRPSLPFAVVSGLLLAFLTPAMRETMGLRFVGSWAALGFIASRMLAIASQGLSLSLRQRSQQGLSTRARLSAVSVGLCGLGVAQYFANEYLALALVLVASAACAAILQVALPWRERSEHA